MIVLSFTRILSKQIYQCVVLHNLAINIEFCITSFILVLFSITYFPVVIGYGLIDTPLLLAISLPIIGYVIGYSINFVNSPEQIEKVFSYAVFSVIFGGIAFVFLSFIKLQGFALISIVANRSLPNFWNPSADSINGPGLDLYVGLAVSLLPYLLYRNNIALKNSDNKRLIIILFLIVILGLSLSISLQGRKALSSVIIAFLFLSLLRFLYSITSKKITIEKLIKIIFTFIIGIGLMFISGYLMEFIYDTGLFNRFQEEGVDTPRYQLWGEVLDNLPYHLDGGRQFKISGSFAHNLWLDVFYDGGIIPMILLLLFHALHIQPIIKIFFSKKPQNVIYMVSCITVSLLSGFQFEPVIQSSQIFFSISCFFIGLFMKLSQIPDKISRQLKVHT
jgi:hypothetical protein